MSLAPANKSTVITLLLIVSVFTIVFVPYIVLTKRQNDLYASRTSGTLVVAAQKNVGADNPPSTGEIQKVTPSIETQEKNVIESLVETATSILPASETRAYIKIVESCGPHFEGECVNARTGPTTSAPVALSLRTGLVLRTDGVVTQDGTSWYRVIFDEPLLYPERVKKELFVASTYGALMNLEAPTELSSTTVDTAKHILVDRSDQHLTAYNEDGSVFMEETISTGLTSTPTPRGTFTIFRKTPSRYMQGPLPGISSDYYDLPGVPWAMYFTEQGGALHGAYWHDKFGRQWSHGCINLPLESAERLYVWADLGTKVVVSD